LTINQLSWQALVPETLIFQEQNAQPASSDTDIFQQLQPRLCYGLTQLLSPYSPSDFMLVKCPATPTYLSLIGATVRKMQPETGSLYGGRYQAQKGSVTLHPVASPEDNFAACGEPQVADWIEHEQLFGSVRRYADEIDLKPGLLHHANGGVLVLSLRTVLLQPLLWLRLRQMVAQKRFDWLPADEARPLPVSAPSLPLQVKVVLCGDRDALADFQEMEPDLAEFAIYSEYEENLQTDNDPGPLLQWRDWVQSIASAYNLPSAKQDAWTPVIREAVRYTGDRETLPLCPEWLLRQLREVAPLCDAAFSGAEFTQMLEQRAWRENFLAERMQDEILLNQILIETEGERQGQVNALSVVEFPGHPRAFGEPSRISCVVHFGDGEFTDIERKAELGGNIHAKGMMIMQSFLMAELELDQQLPFSASLTFEQSYSEVDGDSASAAELCALISALSGAPVNQSLAITGSVDQFGRIQPVGGVNEKVEGFFRICEQRELTGKQGVIIPAANIRHLSLHQDVLDAVEQGQFSIWAVEHAVEAITLLTAQPWDGEGENTLLQAIQERIAQVNQQEARHRYPWPLRWLNWFNHN
jgi:Lon-like ATP-dependent protease